MSETSSGYEVVIVGGGPAGAATAIALRKLGIPCLVIHENESAAIKPGENLPSNISPTLKALGIWELLSDHQHIQSTGNQIYWGSDHPQSREFISEPHGLGWHVNRSYFETQLKNTALSKNVTWLDNLRCLHIQKVDNGFVLQCKDRQGSEQSITACFVVDATGRSARVSRMLGANRISLDRLTGFYSQIEKEAPGLKGRILVEAVSDGWWYAASIGEQKTVLNFMSDADLQDPNPDTLQDWLYDKYQESVQLRRSIAIIHKTQLLHLKIKPTATSVLNSIAGDNWLAVGDAACTYDPLSAYGLSAALGGGLYAAVCIRDCLAGQKEALDAYKLIQQKAFNTCVSMLQHQYRREQRWTESPFWRRRIAQKENVMPAG